MADEQIVPEPVEIETPELINIPVEPWEPPVSSDEVDAEIEARFNQVQAAAPNQLISEMQKARDRAIVDEPMWREMPFMGERQVPAETMSDVLQKHADMVGAADLNELYQRFDDIGLSLNDIQKSVGVDGMTALQYRQSKLDPKDEKGQSLFVFEEDEDKLRTRIRGAVVKEFGIKRRPDLAPQISGEAGTGSLEDIEILPDTHPIAGTKWTPDLAVGHINPETGEPEGEYGYRMAAKILAPLIERDPGFIASVETFGSRQQGIQPYINDQIRREKKRLGPDWDQAVDLERVKKEALRQVPALLTLGLWGSPVFMNYEHDEDTGNIRIIPPEEMRLRDVVKKQIEIIGFNRNGHIVARTEGTTEYIFDVSDLLQSMTVGGAKGVMDWIQGDPAAEGLFGGMKGGMARREWIGEVAMDNTQWIKEHPIRGAPLALAALGATILFPDFISVGAGLGKRISTHAAKIAMDGDIIQATTYLADLANARAAKDYARVNAIERKLYDEFPVLAQDIDRYAEEATARASTEFPDLKEENIRQIREDLPAELHDYLHSPAALRKRLLSFTTQEGGVTQKETVALQRNELFDTDAILRRIDEQIARVEASNPETLTGLLFASNRSLFLDPSAPKSKIREGLKKLATDTEQTRFAAWLRDNAHRALRDPDAFFAKDGILATAIRAGGEAELSSKKARAWVYKTYMGKGKKSLRGSIENLLVAENLPKNTDKVLNALRRAREVAELSASIRAVGAGAVYETIRKEFPRVLTASAIAEVRGVPFSKPLSRLLARSEELKPFAGVPGLDWKVREIIELSDPAKRFSQDLQEIMGLPRREAGEIVRVWDAALRRVSDETGISIEEAWRNRIAGIERWDQDQLIRFWRKLHPDLSDEELRALIPALGGGRRHRPPKAKRKPPHKNLSKARKLLKSSGLEGWEVVPVGYNTKGKPMYRIQDADGKPYAYEPVRDPLIEPYTGREITTDPFAAGVSGTHTDPEVVVAWFVKDHKSREWFLRGRVPLRPGAQGLSGGRLPFRGPDAEAPTTPPTPSAPPAPKGPAPEAPPERPKRSYEGHPVTDRGARYERIISEYQAHGNKTDPRPFGRSDDYGLSAEELEAGILSLGPFPTVPEVARWLMENSKRLDTKAILARILPVLDEASGFPVGTVNIPGRRRQWVMTQGVDDPPTPPMRIQQTKQEWYREAIRLYEEALKSGEFRPIHPVTGRLSPEIPTGPDGGIIVRIVHGSLSRPDWSGATTFERVLRPNFREILDEFYPHVEGKAWQQLSKTVQTKILSGIDAAFVTMPARFPSQVELLGRGNILTGLDETTIVHEFFHVATAYRIGAGIYGVGPEADKARKIIDEMIDIRDKALTYVNKKLKENPDYFGDNSAVFRDYVLRFKKRRTDANRGRIVDEMISYAFTDPDFRRLLSEVPLGEDKTAWSRFVETIAGLFGFGPKDNSALSRVIRLSDELLETDITAVSTWVKDFGELGEGAEDIFAAINLTLTRPADRLRQNLADGILTIAADGTVTSRLGEFVDPEVVSRGPRFIRGEDDPQLRHATEYRIAPMVEDFVTRTGGYGGNAFGATPRRVADPELRNILPILPSVDEWLQYDHHNLASIWQLSSPAADGGGALLPLSKIQQQLDFLQDARQHGRPGAAHETSLSLARLQTDLIEERGKATLQLRPDRLWKRLEMVRALRLDFADFYFPPGSAGRDKVLKAIDDFYAEERALLQEAFQSYSDPNVLDRMGRGWEPPLTAEDVRFRRRRPQFGLAYNLEEVPEELLEFLSDQARQRLDRTSSGAVALGLSAELSWSIDAGLAARGRRSSRVGAWAVPSDEAAVRGFLNSVVSPEQFSANLKRLWGESFALNDVKRIEREVEQINHLLADPATNTIGLSWAHAAAVNVEELEATRNKLNEIYGRLRIIQQVPEVLVEERDLQTVVQRLNFPAQIIREEVQKLSRAGTKPVESIAGGYYELDRATDLAGMERLAQEINDLPWFHGSPQRTITLRDYEIQYSGTGSGNMLGAGLYLTSDPERALTYARRIYGEGAGVVKSVGLNVRKVLDLRGSAEDVVKQLREAGLAEDSIILREIDALGELEYKSARDVWQALFGYGGIRPTAQARLTSEELLNAGIDGIHHRGEFDRDVLVLFDPNANSLDGAARVLATENRQILDRTLYQTREGSRLAETEFLEDGRAMIRVWGNADASSIMHEFAHILRRDLSNESMEEIVSWIIAKGVDVEINPRTGGFVGSADEVRKAEELFAEAFEQYIREGRAPTEGLKDAFERLKKTMVAIYRAVIGSDVPIVEINDAVRRVFDELLGQEPPTEIADSNIRRVIEAIRKNVLGAGLPTDDRSTAKLIIAEARRLGVPLPIARAEQLVDKLVEDGQIVFDKPIQSLLDRGLGFERGGKHVISHDDLQKHELRFDSERALLALRGTDPSVAQMISQPYQAEGDLPPALKSRPIEWFQNRPWAQGIAGRFVMAIYFGGDQVEDLRKLNLPTHVMQNILAVVRPLQQSVGDAISLATKTPEELPRYLAGASDVAFFEGRPALSAGVNYTDNLKALLDNWWESLDASGARTDRVAMQKTIKAICALVQDPKAGSAFGSMTFATASPMSVMNRYPIFRDALSAEGLDGLPRHVKTGEDLLRNLDQIFEGGGGVPTVEFFQGLAHATGVFQRNKDPVLRARLLETTMYHFGFTKRNGKLYPGYVAGNVDFEAATTQYLNSIEVIFKSDVAKQHAGVMIATYGGAYHARQGLEGLHLVADSVTIRLFKEWLDGKPIPDESRHKVRALAEQLGLNPSFTDKDFDELLGSDFYIPEAVRLRIAQAVSQAWVRKAYVREKPASWLPDIFVEGESSGNVAGDLFRIVYRNLKVLITRGRLAFRQPYFFMNWNDHFWQTALSHGFLPAATSLTRLTAHQVAVMPGVAHALWGVTRLPRLMEATQQPWKVFQKEPDWQMPILRPDAMERFREILQFSGDAVVHALKRVLTDHPVKWDIKVNPIMRGDDETIRIGTRSYNAKDVRRIFLEEGIFASFDTRALESIIRDEQRLLYGRKGESLRSFFARPFRNLEDLDMKRLVENTAEAWSERERVGLGATMMELGFNPRQAARLTIDALYDYAGSMSRFDRNIVINLLYPFWAFQKNANRHLFNYILSPWGAYRMNVIRKAGTYGPEYLSWVLYEFTVDPYGIDVQSLSEEKPDVFMNYMQFRNAVENGYGPIKTLTKEQRRMLASGGGAVPKDKAFGLTAEEIDQWFADLSPEDQNFIENGYGGVEKVPPKIRSLLRLMFSGQNQIFRGGEILELSPDMKFVAGIFRDPRGMGFGDVEPFDVSPFHIPRPNKQHRRTYMRNRPSIAVVERRKKVVRDYYTLLNASESAHVTDTPYLEATMPEPTIMAAMEWMVGWTALAISAAAEIGDTTGLSKFAPWAQDGQLGAGGVAFAQGLEALVPVERAPMLEMITSKMAGYDLAPTKIHPSLIGAMEWALPQVPILRVDEKLLEVAGFDSDPFATAPIQLTEAETEEGLKMDQYTGPLAGQSPVDETLFAAAKEDRYYLLPGTVSFLFKYYLGDVNRMFFQMDAVGLEAFDRGKIMKMLEVAGLPSTEVSALRTATAESYRQQKLVEEQRKK